MDESYVKYKIKKFIKRTIISYVEIKGGSNSRVFKFKENNNDYIIKIVDYDMEEEYINYLKILSSKKLIPKIYKIDNDSILMDFFDGETLKLTNSNLDKIFHKISENCLSWHKENFFHGDLHEENILISKFNESVMFIDPNTEIEYRYKENDLYSVNKLHTKFISSILQ